MTQSCVSMITDTFQLRYVYNDTETIVPWTSKGIAWSSETNVRYGQPKSWANTAKPPNWPISEQNRSSTAYSGDEELIVWMRTAALPTFKKLHRIVQHTSQPFDNGLPQGSYILSINYCEILSFGWGLYMALFITLPWSRSGDSLILHCLVLLLCWEILIFLMTRYTWSPQNQLHQVDSLAGVFR